MSDVTQQEILSQTSIVAKGLESLRVEHQQILSSLKESLAAIGKEDGATRFIEDKLGLIGKTLEKLELAVGEADVSFVDVFLKFFYCITIYL